MEYPGEWLWRAGREDAPLSKTVYLDCITRLTDRFTGV